MFWDKSLKLIQKRLEEMSHTMRDHAKDSDVRLDNIEKVLIVQEHNLKEHMKRSEHLEEVVDLMKSKDLDPLRKHVDQVNGAFKFLGILSIVVGIIAGFYKILF